MKKISLFMACALLASVQLTLPKKHSKAGKNGYIPFKWFRDVTAPIKNFHDITVPVETEDKRSHVTEIINDTDYELMLHYPYHDWNCKVISCVELSGKKVALKTFTAERAGTTLPPRSRTIVSGVFIPVQQSKEDKSALVVSLLGEGKDFVQPDFGFLQIGDLIFVDYQFPGRCNTIWRQQVIGCHSFSLIFKQMNDDLLYKSVKTGQLSFHGASLKMNMPVNERECR